MSDPKQSDLRQFISQATRHVFATMLSMQVRDASSDTPLSAEEGRVVAAVGFAGHGIAGGLAINVTCRFAALITATMLGLKPDEIHNPADVSDVMGELANVIGGNCLAALAELGHDCALSLPAVTRGLGVQTVTIRGAKRESVAFEQGQNQFPISLDFKTTSR